MYIFYARISSRFVEPSRVYSRTKESYRLPSRTAAVSGGCSLCFDFVYYWCQPFFLLAPRTLVRFPFSFDSPSTPTPYDQAVRSLQRAVFTNFISFLWGIKSSRSRPRSKERGLVCEQGVRRRESILGPNHPSWFPVTPASRHCSHVAGRSGSHPLVLARRRGASRQRRGCCATLGVVDCNSPDELYIEERFMSCLVKKTRDHWYVFFICEAKYTFGKSVLSFWVSRSSFTGGAFYISRRVIFNKQYVRNAKKKINSLISL